MSKWTAWTRSAANDELGALLRASLAASDTSPAEPRWHFVEGPTCCEFVAPDAAVDLISQAWLVRAFGKPQEIAARRVGFDVDLPWLVRVIAISAPAGDGWTPRPLGRAEEPRRLVLYGTSEADDSYRHGSQFRDAFVYPGVVTPKDHRACIVVQHYAVDGGPSVARWLRLEAH